MAYSRKKELIDNLERVAQELVNYVLDKANSEDILGIIQGVHAVYQGPVNSWVTGWFYQFTRTRGAELKSTVEHFETHGKPADLLEKIIALFKQGGWSSTSANTLVLNQLVINLKKYDVDNTALTNQVLQALSRLFIERGNHELTDIRIKEREQAESQRVSAPDYVPVESKPLNFKEYKHIIASMFEARAAAARLGKNEFDRTIAAPDQDAPECGKLNMEKFAAVQAHFEGRYRKEPELDANAAERPEGIRDVKDTYAKGVAAVAGMFARRQRKQGEVGKLEETYATERSIVAKLFGGK